MVGGASSTVVSLKQTVYSAPSNRQAGGRAVYAAAASNVRRDRESDHPITPDAKHEGLGGWERKGERCADQMSARVEESEFDSWRSRRLTRDLVWARKLAQTHLLYTITNILTTRSHQCRALQVAYQDCTVQNEGHPGLAWSLSHSAGS